MSKISDSLRERILRLEELGYDEGEPMLIQTLEACANQIDAEHERRMEQCRHETKRAMCRYMGSVMEDYGRGIKREARKKAVRSDWGDHVVCSCGRVLEREDKFCPRCGAKLKIRVSESEVLDG